MYKSLYALIGILIVAAVAAFILIHFKLIGTPSSSGTAPISDAYSTIGSKLTLADGDQHLVDALTTFKNVAADEKRSNLERAEALNGINYSYTQSDFDAATIYKVVFSQPPYSQYYVAPVASTTDPLHPQSGTDVAAVEAALVKLNEFSNALYPNHYAISRMEISNVFAYQRGSVGLSSKKALAQKYADQIKTLAAAYDALPPLNTISSYPLAMRIQIMFAHASAVSFVASVYYDSTYWALGEGLFKDTIALGDSYPKENLDTVRIQNETLLARIFYASYFWNRYKKTSPDTIKNVVRPLITADTRTTVYKDYLPSHAKATVAPFTTLRDIAAQMPELKTFLQARGWTF